MIYFYMIWCYIVS